MCYSLEHGFSDIKFAFAYDEKSIQLMLHQKHIPFQDYKNSTQKDEYEYLYKKDDESKGDYITIENVGIVEYGNDFINCKIFDDRDST